MHASEEANEKDFNEIGHDFLSILISGIKAARFIRDSIEYKLTLTDIHKSVNLFVDTTPPAESYYTVALLRSPFLPDGTGGLVAIKKTKKWPEIFLSSQAEIVQWRLLREEAYRLTNLNISHNLHSSFALICSFYRLPRTMKIQQRYLM
jgi:hypothetical protein